MWQCAEHRAWHCDHGSLSCSLCYESQCGSTEIANVPVFQDSAPPKYGKCSACRYRTRTATREASQPSETDQARAYLIAELLDMGNEPAIRLDIAPVNTVQSRRQDYEALLLEHATDTPLSSLVNPLVMDETGLILPLSYRINPNIALGCLDSKIVDLITRYKQVEWKKLRTPLELSFTALETREENFVDWFFHVVKMSYTLSEQQ